MSSSSVEPPSRGVEQKDLRIDEAHHLFEELILQIVLLRGGTKEPTISLQLASIERWVHEHYVLLFSDRGNANQALLWEELYLENSRQLLVLANGAPPLQGAAEAAKLFYSLAELCETYTNPL